MLNQTWSFKPNPLQKGEIFRGGQQEVDMAECGIRLQLDIDDIPTWTVHKDESHAWG